jgi:hypothetical protein
VFALSVWLAAVTAQSLPPSAPHSAASHRSAFRARFVPFPGDELSDVGAFSFGLFGDRAATVKGAQVSLFFAQAKRFAGLQLTAGVNFADDDWSGAQIAGLANFTTTGAGLQAAGINLAHRLSGVQAGLGNATTEGRGLQVGALNSASGFAGAQLGVANCAESVIGADVGLVNFSRWSAGLSLGLANVAGGLPFRPCGSEETPSEIDGVGIGGLNVTHAQGGLLVGAVNVVGEIHGFTVGAINVARSSSSGESLALINLVGDGIHDLALYATEAFWSNVALDLGSRHLYTRWVASYQPGTAPAASTARLSEDARRFGFGGGVGWRFFFPYKRVAAIDLESALSTVHSSLETDWATPTMVCSLRGVLHLALHGAFAAVVGPSLNVSVVPVDGDLDPTIPDPRLRLSVGTKIVSVYPGFVAGIEM